MVEVHYFHPICYYYSKISHIFMTNYCEQISSHNSNFFICVLKEKEFTLIKHQAMQTLEKILSDIMLTDLLIKEYSGANISKVEFDLMVESRKLAHER